MALRISERELAALTRKPTNEKPAHQKKARPIPTEHQEQVAVINWARVHEFKWPELKLLHAVPNGGLRRATTNAKGKRYSLEAQRLRNEGVSPGLPDLDLPVARRGFHGLRIEMKALDGRASKDQRWWIEQLSQQGYLAVVKFGAEAAIKCLEWYLTANE